MARSLDREDTMRKLSTIVILLAGVLAGPALPAKRPRAALPDNIKNIVTRSCSVSGCHQGRYPTGNLNLEPDKFLASVLDAASLEAPGKKIVDTASPEKSYLLAKIKGEPGIVGARMPAGRDPLSADQIKAVETWIAGLKGGSARTGVSGGNGGGGNGHDLQAGKEPPAASRKPAFDKPAFWGTRIVNLPTAETIDRGRFLFRISHRFVPAVSSGWDGFYGLDGPAFVMPSFGYGITDQGYRRDNNRNS